MIWQTTAFLDKRIISVFRFAIHDKARAIILNLRHGISKNLPADELTTPSGNHYYSPMLRKSMTLRAKVSLSEVGGLTKRQ